MKKLIASADRQALTSLLQANLTQRTAGVVDKDSDFITKQVIDDHAEYNATLVQILKDDKSEAFDPNDIKQD